jgi:hypothetical protein
MLPAVTPFVAHIQPFGAASLLRIIGRAYYGDPTYQPWPFTPLHQPDLAFQSSSARYCCLQYGCSLKRRLSQANRQSDKECRWSSERSR